MTDHLRRMDGDETWSRLREWTKGQKASERLAGNLLKAEGFDVDPSHPLGGADGGKDALCRKEGLTLVAAVYFPRGQQSIGEIERKFLGDLEGVAKNGADAIVFVTNQELRLSDRKRLADLGTGVVVELYHLERLTLLLNTPTNYGLRLEYLGIRITEEEYLAFLANRDSEHFQRFEALNGSLTEILSKLERQTKDLVGYSTGGDSVAYFIPMIPGPNIVELGLQNMSDYPVFDIQGYYIDLDEPGIDPPNARFWTNHRFSFGSLYPRKIIMSAIRFNLTDRPRYRINVFIQTRTSSVSQQFRMVRQNDRIQIAYKTQAGESFQETKVPADFPDYDPGDPDAVFK